MQQIVVYISAKLDHAAKLAALRADGFHINARWIEMAEAGRKRLKPVNHWQAENFMDIASAHFFMLYVEPSDRLKGSLVELGYALGIGKRCWIAGNGQAVEVTPDGAANSIMVPHRDVLPWGLYRQRIRLAPTVQESFHQMRALVRPDVVTNMDGSAGAVEEF